MKRKPLFAEMIAEIPGLAVELKAIEEEIRKRYGCQDCQKATQGQWPIYSSTCPQCTERMLEAGKEEYK